uniref:phosphatidate phosphatase n=1 Tax=Esox lucius TaxID=8010 RepID=A0A6Q2YS83_ESOLU
MNYVGQLAETVFVTVKELYRGLNPATLTGAIDVIVVRQPDGSLQCSPFHVRFGKLGVLRSKEKVVDMEVNGEPVQLQMKLGDNGEAFFVEENEDFEVSSFIDLLRPGEVKLCLSTVPAHLCTSPIHMELLGEAEEPLEQPVSSGSMRRKKRRRKRIRSESHRREDGSSSSDERELSFFPPSNSKSVYFSLSEEPNEDLSAMQSRDIHPHSEGEWSPSESVFYSRPSSPKSDSELLMKPQDSLGPQMQWSWGGFPKMCPAERGTLEVQRGVRPSVGSHFRTIQRQDSFDMGLEPGVNSSMTVVVRPKPRIAVAQPTESSLIDLEGTTDVSHSTPIHPTSDPSTLASIAVASEPGVILTEETDVVEACTGGLKAPDSGTAVTSSATSGSLANQAAEGAGVKDAGANEAVGEGHTGSADLAGKAEHQDRKKGKRSQHLGPSDIYLDDLSNLNPEVAALYFPPKNETEVGLRLDAELGPGSGNQTPQSVGSGAVDSGMEYLSDSASDHMDVSMSLCGGTGHTSQINRDKFLEHLVKYQDLVSNPGIIEDPNLVICINSKYYNWAVAAPMVLSMQVFQKSLPKSTIDQLVKVKMPKKSGRWWFWRRKDMDTNHIQAGETSKKDQEDGQSETEVSVAATGTSTTVLCGEGSLSSETVEKTNTAQCFSQMYRKSLRLTSEQIERLNLREGANTVMFSVTTQYQGTCRCEAAIYLWNWNDRVVISDIDGTITKSDALGHILPQLGKDWTHHGIARLYHKIHQNGYKFLYCSARAIGMADITKGYLQWVNDKGTVLPKGPVLLAPSSFFSALHREVVEKKPEVFKIACLTDIRDLFNPQRQPFYAAFGNRTNDAYAYKEVGVPDTKIFTVNPKGELVQEKNKGTKSSYTHLGELVEHFFPMISQDGWSSSFDCPEYSHFSYWREPLPPLDLSALN